MFQLDATTLAALREYKTDVAGLTNETAKTHRFIALIERLFPGSPATAELASGVEKLVRIDVNGARHGRIDAYYGNAVIEFEVSLKAKEAEARRQLRQYCAGLWQDPRQRGRPLLGIAADGLTWKIFHPRLVASAAPGAPESVELGEPIRTLAVTESTFGDFYHWLTRLLFREGRIQPSAQHFRADFGASSPVFADAMHTLRKAWSVSGESPEQRLALDTWRRYLTVTYGQLSGISPHELTDLFLRHTYLAGVAKLLCWAALARGKTSNSLREKAAEVLSGRFFRSQQIENLVEDDFFQWVLRPDAEALLAPVWERAIADLLAYDLTQLDQDILKAVYQELVDPQERHDLGEYYTPDWLCERIVAELLPAEGFAGVLDPSCGSGGFLRAAIAHMLAANPKGGKAARLRAVLDNVTGIDIHPLAVTIARATYVLAVRDLVTETGRPIQIPVYLADSLFLPAEVLQLCLDEVPHYELLLGGRRVSVPERFVEDAALFDHGVAAAAKVAVDHAGAHTETRESLRSYLTRAVPRLRERRDAEDIFDSLWRLAELLAELIEQRQDSIWAFIVKNSYRPAMLRGRFDFIVGNPPWLSYRYIADPEYQSEIKKRAVEDYAIAPSSQKLFTQMELATVFLMHALTTFGRAGAKLGFVMPRSVLSADQHDRLRTRKYKPPVWLTECWDLAEVSPLFNVPSCVLFAQKNERRSELQTAADLPTVEWSGRLARREVPWALAQRDLRARKTTSRVVFLGSRTALSPLPGRDRPNRPSPYAKRFYQGATIVPRNFYFVAVDGLSGPADPDRVYWARTEPEQAREAKPPYQGVKMSGLVEDCFLFSTATSKHVLPFACSDPATVVLPAFVDDEGNVTIRNVQELRLEGYRELASWMAEAEEIWRRKRKKKAESHTVYEWLDYQGKLTRQNLEDRHLVLYNAAGTHLAAARLDRKEQVRSFVVDHKLYWTACASAAEADYLAAFLNAGEVNARIKPFQSRGLLGERDIHKKVLELPIPLYDPRDAAHRSLAEIGGRARSEAQAFPRRAALPRSLGRRRSKVREALADILVEIDALARKILSN